MRVERTTLETGPKRSVLRERCLQGGRPVTRVVKRFHAPGWLDRWKDAHRATREFRALERLRAAGLPAPEPVEVRRREGRWELVQAEVPGARSLAALLDGTAPWPVHRRLALARAARVLVRLERAGLRHPDLHPGNLLLDGDGHPWLVDAARLGRAPRTTEDRRRALLVHLCADARERSTPALRAVFLGAYLKALGPEQRRGLGPRAELVRNVEGAARHRRRERGTQRVARWTRPSGAVVPGPDGGWVARDRTRRRAELQGLDLGLRGEAARAAWSALGRMMEHRIPSLVPLRLGPDGTPGPEVGVPDGARPLSAAVGAALRPPLGLPLGLEDLRPRPEALGRWLGDLHDRGLDRPDLALEDLWITPDGSLLGGPVPLVPLDAGPDPEARPRLALRRALPLLGEEGNWRAPFLRAYVDRQGDPREVRQALLAALAEVPR